MLNAEACKLIAQDLTDKWCLPGRNGGGVSMSNIGDCCQFTVTIASKLVKSTAIKIILKAALFDKQFITSSERIPSYVFLIRVYADRVCLTCTEDGVVLFTRECGLEDKSVNGVIDCISNLMAFSYLPNIWNNEDSINFCQPLCITYRHIWWRILRSKTKTRLTEELNLVSNTPSVFQLGSNGLRELLYTEFKLKQDTGIIVNEFARKGRVCVTAGKYKFYFSCFQLTPSHVTVFYIARKLAKSSNIDKEEFRIFLDFDIFKKAIPNIIKTMGLKDIVEDYEETAADDVTDSIILSEEQQVETTININLEETEADDEVVTADDILQDEDFDPEVYVEPSAEGCCLFSLDRSNSVSLRFSLTGGEFYE